MPSTRYLQKLRCRRSSIVNTWNTGTPESDRRICSRTAGVIDAGLPATRIVRPKPAAGSNRYRHIGGGIDFGTAVALKVLEVRDDADDGEPRRSGVPRKPERSANGIVRSPQPPRHRLVDESDWIFRRAFVIGEVAAADERDAERPAQVRRRSDEVNHGSWPRSNGFPFYQHLATASAATHWHETRSKGRLDTGQAFDTSTTSSTRRTLASAD